MKAALRTKEVQAGGGGGLGRRGVAWGAIFAFMSSAKVAAHPPADGFAA